MEDALWGVTWVNATMYLATIPVVDVSSSSENNVEHVSPEDELKYIKLGNID